MVTKINIEFGSDGEEFHLYFDIEHEGLRTQTFGNALLAFDQLYRSINAVVNPGVEVEVKFIRSEKGSIRVVFKALKNEAKAVVKRPITNIILPFLIAFLVTKLPSEQIKIIPGDNDYIVKHGSEQCILPRDKVERVENDGGVNQSVQKFFAVCEADPNIRSVDFQSSKLPNLVFPISRDKFPIILALPAIGRRRKQKRGGATKKGRRKQRG